MSFVQKLAVKQGQSLVMTPQLSQSIKLLALSNIELTAFVEDELERNPLLEMQAGDFNEERGMGQVETTKDVVPELSSNDEMEVSAKGLSENLGTSVENEFPDEQDYRAAATDNAKTIENQPTSISNSGLQLSGSASSHDQSVADYSSSPETLRDVLAAQLAISSASPDLTFVVNYLIDNLDDAGYLREPLDAIAQKLGCDDEISNAALALLQSFEPAGVGARDLSECLGLQLSTNDRLDPAMQVIIDNLDLLAKRDFTSLQKLSGLDIEDLHDGLSEIRNLDPKPGTTYSSSPVQHVVADVLVSEAHDGSWRIELNSETLPSVLVNNDYAIEVSPKLTNTADKEFISQCLQTANWLTKSLNQRAQTILKVSREIVKLQDAFLVHGVRHLRPLTLREVADEIEMHESTVSRVTSNKYMMTPRGLFELKYFFTTGIAGTEHGTSHSSESVRDRIKSLIDAESAKKVLSDDAIVEALKNEGIDIARRTVAKYRDAMHIPSSVQRRREKRALELSRRNDPTKKVLKDTH